MQIKYLPAPFYRKWRISDAPPEALQRLHKIEICQKLREQGCTEALALQTIDWSRATFFRWQKRYRDHGLAGLVARSRRPHQCRTPSTCKEQQWQVWEMRNRYPFMGKRKLHIMLQREGLLISESTIGRILSRGRELGHIQPCSFCEGRLTARRHRVFNRHAKRWKYGTKAKRPGEFVQMDVMTVSAEGTTIKEFKAVSPVDKFMVTQSYSRATSHNAKRFLQTVIDELPYPLLSIQVDGGSEFMAEFEQACAARNIPLYVLPPRSPKFNGVVERANRTTRIEFWNAYLGELNLPAVNQALKLYQHFYNHIRPHQAIGGATPMAYLNALQTPDCARQDTAQPGS